MSVTICDTSTCEHQDFLLVALPCAAPCSWAIFLVAAPGETLVHACHFDVRCAEKDLWFRFVTYDCSAVLRIRSSFSRGDLDACGKELEIWRKGVNDFATRQQHQNYSMKL